MRILHVVPTYLPATRYGGPINSVHGLCRALARRGHDIQVYTTDVDGPGVSDVPLGKPVLMDDVTVTYFPTGLGRRIYRSPAMAEALARNMADFDIVHLHSVFLWPTSVAAHMARRYGVPYVISPRGMLVPELIQRKSRIAKWTWLTLFERRNLKMAAAVHVTADIEAKNLQRLGLGTRRIAEISNGVEVPQSSVHHGTSPLIGITKPFVFFLGRITWKKGPDKLIPAFREVPGAELVIAGNDEEGYTAKLIALAKEHGVGSRTHFIGPLYGPAKWRALAEADLFALPSYSENFGIAVLEALAVGVPVIVTPEVGLAEDVSKHGAGLVVEGDSGEIALVINQLLQNPHLCREMGEAGRNLAVKRFSWDAIAVQMEDLYSTLEEKAELPHASLAARSVSR